MSHQSAKIPIVWEKPKSIEVILTHHMTSECCHQDKILSLEEGKHPYIAFTFPIQAHFTKFMEQESQNEDSTTKTRGAVISELLQML